MQGNGVFIIVIIKVKTCFLIFPPVNLGKPTEFGGLCTLWRRKHIVIFPVSLVIGYSVSHHTYKAYHNPQTYKNRKTLKIKEGISARAQEMTTSTIPAWRSESLDLSTLDLLLNMGVIILFINEFSE